MLTVSQTLQKRSSLASATYTNAGKKTYMLLCVQTSIVFAICLEFYRVGKTDDFFEVFLFVVFLFVCVGGFVVVVRTKQTIVTLLDAL